MGRTSMSEDPTCYLDDCKPFLPYLLSTQFRTTLCHIANNPMSCAHEDGSELRKRRLTSPGTDFTLNRWRTETSPHQEITKRHSPAGRQTHDRYDCASRLGQHSERSLSQGSQTIVIPTNVPPNAQTPPAVGRRTASPGFPASCSLRIAKTGADLYCEPRH